VKLFELLSTNVLFCALFVPSPDIKNTIVPLKVIAGAGGGDGAGEGAGEGEGAGGTVDISYTM
jgi:hypothetical protein